MAPNFLILEGYEFPKQCFPLPPKGSAGSIIEARPNLEADTLPLALQRTEGARGNQARLGGGPLRVTQFVALFFIGVVHPLDRADDHGFVVVEAFQLQQNTFLHRGAAMLVVPVRVAHHHAFPSRSKALCLIGQQFFERADQAMLDQF